MSRPPTNTVAPSAADFERSLRETSTRMTLPQNAMDVDSDLSDISDELNHPPSNAYANTPYGNTPYGNTSYGNTPYGATQPAPQFNVQQHQHQQLQHQQQQQARQMQFQPPPSQPKTQPQAPPPKRGLFGLGRRKDEAPPSQQQQKRLSVEKRQSIEKRLSNMNPDQPHVNKRASLEIKLHDGLIVVDEEERNRINKKANQQQQQVFNHPIVNHFQHQSPTRAAFGNSPAGPMSQQQQQYDPRVQRPPTQPQYPQQHAFGGNTGGPAFGGPQYQQRPPPPGMGMGVGPSAPIRPGMSPQPVGMGGGPMAGSGGSMAFQGPPRQGSLNNVPAGQPQQQQQFQRPTPPGQFQQQQPIYAPLMNGPNAPLTPSSSTSGSSFSSQFPGMTTASTQQSSMPGSRPLYNTPNGTNPGGPPNQPQNQLLMPAGLPSIPRQSPMMLDHLQSQTWDSQKYNTTAPPLSQQQQQQPPPQQQVAPTNMGMPPAKHPPVIPEEQFVPTNDADANEEYYDDDDSDDESAASFISFDEETEDNTEYNAIVDYDLLDVIMGGSTDYEAPMPRVSHGRKIVFNSMVKAQSFVRVLKDGEVGSGGVGDPDGATEMEEEEEEEEYDDEESEVDESPPSPVVEVVSLVPLRPADLEGEPVQPEITPRGVSLKMAAGAGGGEFVAADSVASVSPPVSVDPVESVVEVSTKSIGTGEVESPLVDDAAMLLLPPAPSQQPQPARKKVRHVLIQTRGATLKHQQTMTELTMATESLDNEFNLLSELPGGSGGGGGGSSSKPVTLDSAMVTDPEEVDPRIPELEAETVFLQAQNEALREQLGQMQAMEEARRVERQTEKDQFDRLSAAAMKKIQELMVERKMMEVEVDGLRRQVGGLEELVGRWTMDE
ncbi:hypothetical protein HDU98_006967 [Podochytrium sp. JEL0797]|nr:hypothetical protein HDU98_006967 [Podochytrium sp. JEL0797]